jgi:protease IV
MKLSSFSMPRLSREARVASLAAILLALGAICLDLRWHAAGIILLIAAAAIAAAFYALVIRPSRIPKDATLTLRITDGLREDAPRSPIEQLRSRGMPTLFHLRLALEAAASDPGLKSVIVEISAPGIGIATAQELHDLLRAIAAGGKRVVAILSGDSVTVRDYLIACGASEIIVNPDTAFMMLGVTAGGFFLKNALAKLGVTAQTLQWKEYKGAAEMFSRDAMSPELRESLEAIVNDWKTILVENVSASRKLSAERARELLGAGFMSVRSACEAGLVDRAGYIDDLRAEIEPEDKDKKFVSLIRYLRHVAYKRHGERHPRLALIHGLGPVITGEGPAAGEFLSAERVAEDIRRAASDDSVRAIVFRVNSPGGSPVASDLVWRAVREAQRRGKPVVVSMGDVAGSGGYYVAMGADAIVAEPATITGSIGVVYAKFSISDLLRQLGVGVDVAKSDAVSDALSFARQMTEQELAQLNQVLGELYANFTGKVAAGRKLDLTATEEIARGRVWSGVAAKAHGLVDELGGLARAIALAREKAGFDESEQHDLVLYPSPNILAALNLTLSRSEMPLALALGARAVDVPERWAPALLWLLTRGGVSLLCPFMRT